MSFWDLLGIFGIPLDPFGYPLDNFGITLAVLGPPWALFWMTLASFWVPLTAERTQKVTEILEHVFVICWRYYVSLDNVFDRCVI